MWLLDFHVASVHVCPPAHLPDGMLPTNWLTHGWMSECLRFHKSTFSGTQRTCGEPMAVATASRHSLKFELVEQQLISGLLPCYCCLRNNERYYGFARTEYERDGRKIIDATLDGKCQVFEKADYLGAI